MIGQLIQNIHWGPKVLQHTWVSSLQLCLLQTSFLMLTGNNRQRHILWCRGKRHWQTKRWQKVIFSDKTQVVIGQNNSISLLRKTSKKNQRISPIKVSWIFLGCTTMALVIPINGNLNSMKYLKLLDFHVWPNVAVIVKVFGNRLFIFQDDNATPLCSRQRNRSKRENRIKKNWPVQSPDVNIIKISGVFFKI